MNKHKAFSLIEAMVAAVVLVTVLTVIVTASTQKAIKDAEEESGVYTCRCTNQGTIESFYMINGRMTEGRVRNNRCIFYPPTGAEFFAVKVWNVLNVEKWSRDLADNFAVTSFPEKMSEISLGNQDDHDVVIAGALRTQIPTQHRCTGQEATQENCNGATVETGWLENSCFYLEIDNQQACQNVGGEWMQFNTCVNGVNVEIEW